MLHGSDASWETFRRSAEVRRDDTYEVLSQHFSAGGGPFGGYHRSCYQTYTNKTLLARLQRDESKAESENKKAGFDLVTGQAGAGAAQIAQSAMSCLGCSASLTDETMMNPLELFTCYLYGKPAESSIDEVRYQLFCTKPTESSNLPPCSNTLRQHMHHASTYLAHCPCGRFRSTSESRWQRVVPR